MMRTGLAWLGLAALALCYISGAKAESNCKIATPINGDRTASCKENNTYSVECATAIKDHVKMEFSASLQYLVMGAFFGQDNINLFGFSDLFYKSAGEERTHGLKFIEYLRMRGHKEEDFFTELKPKLGKASWENAEEALRHALIMEKEVTSEIKKLIDVCEKEDYFSADWLTGEWLDEQLRGQRDLSGMINTFTTFRRDYESLADWMFDRHLLSKAV